MQKYMRDLAIKILTENKLIVKSENLYSYLHYDGSYGTINTIDKTCTCFKYR